MHTTPTFEYEHRDQEARPAFSYLCDVCAQKKLAEWLQCAGSPDYALLGYLTAFDTATVYYEQKNAERQTSLEQASFNGSQISSRVFPKAPLLTTGFLPVL